VAATTHSGVTPLAGRSSFQCEGNLGLDTRLEHRPRETLPAFAITM
jgi:hypothetical protein